MPNLDWKKIVDKILSWGFPAVLSILGIIIMSLNENIADGEGPNRTAIIGIGAMITTLGAVLYCLLELHNSNVKILKADNKNLFNKVNELEKKVEDMRSELEGLKLELTKKSNVIENLQNEINRKQAKIDKLISKTKENN